MGSKMIEEFNMRVVLGGFNHNQTRDMLQGFQNEIFNGIDGERVWRRKYVVKTLLIK